MAIDLDKLPDDVHVLKQFIAELDARGERLSEQVRLLLAQIYGRRSERRVVVDESQLKLFVADTPVEVVVKPESTEVGAHSRKRPARQVLSDLLPRLELVHDIPDEEKTCQCGAIKTRIGEETSERLDVIPARLQILRHIRPKYACRKCQGTNSKGPAVAIAPPPLYLIPKGIPSDGLLAHITTSKFVDGLPLYRQEAQFSRIGVNIRRATMCGWIFKVSEACAPLMEALRKEVRAGPLIQADETTLQVLKEPGRAPTTNSYMWVFRGGMPRSPAIEFLYDPSRGADVPKAYLEGYQGYVQTDDYAAYDFLDASPGIRHLGCWSHGRRKFIEVCKATGTPESVPRTGVAAEAIDRIAQLYAIEKSAGVMSVEERQALRQEKAGPRLQEFNEWLKKWAPAVPPRSLLGKAISYSLNQWPRLIRYLENGLLHPDNNLAENAIRPFVVGRKNWLFSDTPAGAEASARLYSLVETAKANDIDPYWYLRYLFDQLPSARSADDYRSLLPQYVDRALVAPYHRPRR